MKTTAQNIPKGWQKKQIKDLLDYERPDKYIVESDRYIKTGTPVLTANKSFVLGYTDEKEGIYKDLPVIVFDDFTTDSKYADFPFKVKSSAIKLLKNKEDVDLRFVYEKMKSITFPTGSHKRYYISQYQNMEVLVPPLNEQKKIAEILSVVDEEIQKTDGIITSTEKLKRGLMEKVFSFKKSWKVSTLNEIATIIMGQSPSSDKYNDKNIGLPLIQGNADIKDRKSIKRFYTSEITKKVNEGDILMTVRAPVGYVAIASHDSCIGRGVCGIQPKKIDKKYLFYFLINQEDNLQTKAQGTTFTAINSNDVKGIKILFPDNKKEQEEIARILSIVDDKISINQKIRGKLVELKNGLMKDLISGNKRV